MRTGMAVVTNAGLVGRVERVDATTSAVLLLTDTDLIVGVRLADTDEVGLGHVDPDDPSIFIVDTGLEWPEDEQRVAAAGARHRCGHAATSRYPAEIPLGRIVESPAWRRGHAHDAVRVALANDITDLGFVSVLLAEGVDQVPLDEPVEHVDPAHHHDLRWGGIVNTPVRLGIVFVVALVIQLTVFVDVRSSASRRNCSPSSPWSRRSSWAPSGGGHRLCRWPAVGRLPADSAGVSAVIFAVVAYVVATLNEGLFHDTRTQLVGVVAVGSAASVIGYALLGAIVGEGGLISADLIVIALVVGAFNAVLAPIAAPIMAWALAAEVDRR